MKRAITGIVAASLALGMMAPAAFAATTTAPTLTASGAKTISLDGSTLYAGVQAGTEMDNGQPTQYFPIYYLNQALTKAGYVNTYDASTKTWNIQMPGVDASKITVAGGVGTGDGSIAINGVVVKKVNVGYHKDFAGGPNAQVTTYMPIYYLGNVLAAAGFSNAWDGTSFGFTSNYGTAAGVTVSAANSNLVANGASTDAVTVSVVDANGHVVRNFNGKVDLSDTNSQLVKADGTLTNSLPSVTVTNGQATVKIQATNIPGATDTITATNAIATNSVAPVSNASGTSIASTTVTQVAQVATSVAVTPTATTVENNVSTEDGFSAQVLDQAGKAMLTGTYPITLTIAGPGKFDTATATSTAYVGDGLSTAAVTGNVWSQQGQSGNITITATSAGLAAGTATIKSTVVGSPAAVSLAVDTNSANSFVAGTTSGTANSSVFDLSTVDANGNAVTDNSAAPYTATIWQGTKQITSGVSAAIASGKVTVTGTAAGTYTLKVTSADSLTPATTTFTITPNVAYTVAITSPANNVNLPIGSDSTTVTGQLEDAYNNPVAQAGVPVEFTVRTTSGSDAATLGGATTGKYTTYTDANGKVSVSFVGSHTTGDAWSVGIDNVDNASASTTPVAISMTGAVPTKITVALQDTSVLSGNDALYANSKTYAEGGDTVTGTVTATDSYGNPSPSLDTVQITLPAGLTAVSGLTATSTTGVYTAQLGSNGQAVFVATAAKSGVASVQAQDLSVGSTSVTGTGSIDVLPGAVTGAAFFYNGQEITSANELTVAANTPVQVTLKPVDSQGNPGVEGASAQYFNVTDQGFGGQFKTASNGGYVSNVELPAGSAGVTLWYQNGVAGSYDLVTGTANQLNTVTHAVASVASSTVASGSTDAVTVTLYDANGNVVPYTGSLNDTLTESNAGDVTAAGTASFTNGVATVNLTGATAGTDNVAINLKNGAAAVTSTNPVSVTVGVGAAGAVVATTPSATGNVSADSLAGAGTTFTFTVKDAAGNTVAAGTKVDFALAGSQGTAANYVLSGASATTNASGQVTVTVKNTTGALAGDTFGVAATIDGTAHTVTSPLQTVIAGAVKTVTVTPSTTVTIAQTAGGTSQFAAVAKDQFGNTVSGQTFVWSVVPATTGDASPATVDNTGLVTVTANTTTKDTYTIKATDGSVAGSGTLTVN